MQALLFRWNATLFGTLAGAVIAFAHQHAGSVPEAAALADAMLRHRIVLLGEVHDNAHQHALRLQAFDALLAAGARPALLMEQFDRERQADIDRARAVPGADRAERVIAAGAPPRAGWNWTFYRPFVERALAHDLPIVAVNVSRDDARRVMAEGLAAHGFDAEVSPQVEAAQAQAIQAGHCGLLEPALARSMAIAQIARDQFMARRVEASAERGVVLLTGNGHARRDIGVPLWLSPSAQKQAVSIGLLEDGDGTAAGYDRTFVTPRQPRDDPCDALRKPLPAAG